ncbi:L-asparaginase precursor [Cordyceps fumosorosea ARSEF 2679]|uniref:L-asparaginase n=1 Tax=Cordyceps fumosorosea (strain ARSEF 2679) TaxID=1081104 RepID=A0A168AR00_CORFA|nr:L-asparaginase precursor [Cordyceps fumosorosea ARSEF 2679]OAA69077.1 L-asparaginase precursor [Cordyceps fumosorosea ARSEF 2679]
MYSEKRTPRAGSTPRLVIHGGAGNIVRHGFPVEKYEQYRTALLKIIANTQAYMTTPVRSDDAKDSSPPAMGPQRRRRLPSALEVATHAVAQLEDEPLFNSGHGAVFTRDGVNELEASVMVSRGFRKRGVGVMGLRRVRNPVLLARAMLEHGEQDLVGPGGGNRPSTMSGLDVPSAQGHTQIYGEAAEQLARAYGCAMVEPAYFYTRQRWDEHVRALEREGEGTATTATWAADEFLPQGTCGAVAMDEDGVVCAATSTGGMTNKLTGRVGDTPVPGAGFWAEEWTEWTEATATATATTPWERLVSSARAPIELTGSLRGLLADCLPTPFLYSPVVESTPTTRCLAVSSTGNGDSFLRVNAARTVAAMARWKPQTGAAALRAVAGPGGELQRSAGERWGAAGEGEGGMIGIEAVVTREGEGGAVTARGEILMTYNCGGLYRAWIDNDGKPVMSIWSNTTWDELPDGDHFE